MPIVRNRELKLAALCLLPLLACGCASNMGPKMPKELTAPSASLYPAGQLEADVKAYGDAISRAGAAQDQKTRDNELQNALALRNRMAYRVMADIESNYGRFEMKLSSSRATQSTLADATTLGLTAATTVVGASDVKDILAATGSAFQGTWTSYDKNFFQQKSTEALIAQMRATRRILQAQLITSLGKRDVKSYPWEAVWMDLVDFYYAGTVPSAMVELASNAGANADAATVVLKSAAAELTPRTLSQAQQAKQINAAYHKLVTDATGTDQATAASAVKTIKQILNAAGYSVDSNAGISDLVTQLQQAMSDAAGDNNKFSSLYSAFTAANAITK